ncbi:hypothetical protein AB0I68_33400 [Streptomyces sp. NPDC050448]|uniref:hypothetical protein n=1 Tax=Streptomyces sp. NPDC050448 TaxID=3155404 RepID=UPI0034132017
MGGYAGDWTAVLYGMALLWLVYGLFVMAAFGVWSGRAAAGRSRTWAYALSVAVPAVVLGIPGYARFRPGGGNPTSGDVLFFFGVEVGLITVLPWLLGWGGTRLVAVAVRRRRRKNGQDPGVRRGAAG